MIHDDLLLRMMHRDMDAFLEMTEKYSWTVYSLIREKFSDKNKVESVYNETMNGFYNGLSQNNGNDPVEALLLMYAQKVCQANTAERADPKQEIPKYKSDSALLMQEKKTGGFLYSLCIFFLVSAILAVIWVILGLLMDMNFIPNYDLGYAWFNTNVLPWF